MPRPIRFLSFLVPVLCAGAAAVLAAPAAVAEDELPPTSEFFDEYDTNADGRVTQDEFRGSREVFRLLDKNDDGEVAPDELGLPADYKPDPRKQARRAREAGKQPRGGGAGRAMQRLYERVMKQDGDGDGRVSAAEWRGREQGFARLDRNDDGFIDRKDLGGALGGDKRRGAGKGKGKGDAAGRTHDEAESAAMRAQAKARFAQTDRNGDGKLTADELPAERFLQLLDKNKDGAVDEAEFLAFVQKRGRSGGPQGGDARRGKGGGGRRLNAGMLRRWDRDGDGRVVKAEFPGGDEMFARLDADGDGALTQADIAAAKREDDGSPKAPTTPGADADPFARQDTDGDGRLHRAEFQGTAEAWRRLDANRDGYVTRAEHAAGR